MVTEDYVSFEVAKLLRESGFDTETYASIKVFAGHNYEVNGEWITPKEDTIIPTIQMAMKWLRNTYNLFIDVDWDSENFYFIIITDMIKRDYVKADISGNEYKSYEQACEAAIRYCLENLI